MRITKTSKRTGKRIEQIDADVGTFMGSDAGITLQAQTKDMAFHVHISAEELKTIVDMLNKSK